MKGKQIRFFVYCLVIGLIASLVAVMSGCSSKSTSTSAPVSSSQIVTTTSSSSSQQTTTTTTTGTIAGTISSIAVTPSSVTNLKIGYTQYFTATATYTDGSTGDITYSATWTSADPTIAEFIPVPGSTSSQNLVTGMHLGTTTITATFSGVTSPPASITVVALPF